MGSRSKVTLGGLLVVSSAVGAATPQTFVPMATEWALVVRAADTSGTNYWVGLRNAAKEPRAFCRYGVMYEIDLRGGDTLGSSTKNFPSIGSPHRCARKDSHLVLPGETHFVLADVVIPADAAPGERIRFQATAEQACLDDKPCPRIAIFVQGRAE